MELSVFNNTIDNILIDDDDDLKMEFPDNRRVRILELTIVRLLGIIFERKIGRITEPQCQMDQKAYNIFPMIYGGSNQPQGDDEIRIGATNQSIAALNNLYAAVGDLNNVINESELFRQRPDDRPPINGAMRRLRHGYEALLKTGPSTDDIKMWLRDSESTVRSELRSRDQNPDCTIAAQILKKMGCELPDEIARLNEDFENLPSNFNVNKNHFDPSMDTKCK